MITLISQNNQEAHVCCQCIEMFYTNSIIMDLIKLITDNQLEFIRIYHLELKRKGHGALVFKKTQEGNDAQVAFYALSEIRSAYVSQRISIMMSEIERALESGSDAIQLKNRTVISLPAFSASSVELPDGISVPQVMFFVLMDGSVGRIFLVMPQDCEAGYCYQMFADPTPEEMKRTDVDTSTMPAAVSSAAADKHQLFKRVCQLALNDERLFRTFRSAKEYRCAIGYETELDGERYAQTCEKFNVVKSDDYRDIKYIDDIGMPVQYYYAEAGRDLSPCTLGYIVAYLETKSFCNGSLNDRVVVEMNAGYGGLCAVSNILEPELGRYICVEDSQLECDLTKRYLECAGVTKNVEICNFEQFRASEYGEEGVVLIAVNNSFMQIDKIVESVRIVKPRECYIRCQRGLEADYAMKLSEYFDKIIVEERVVKGRKNV